MKTMNNFTCLCFILLIILFISVVTNGRSISGGSSSLKHRLTLADQHYNDLAAGSIHNILITCPKDAFKWSGDMDIKIVNKSGTKKMIKKIKSIRIYDDIDTFKRRENPSDEKLNWIVWYQQLYKCPFSSETTKIDKSSKMCSLEFY